MLFVRNLDLGGEGLFIRGALAADAAGELVVDPAVGDGREVYTHWSGTFE